MSRSNDAAPVTSHAERSELRSHQRGRAVGHTVKNEKAAIEKLKARLDAEKLTGKDAPTFAYYDPPWTPTFTRRNKVIMPIEKHHE